MNSSSVVRAVPHQVSCDMDGEAVVLDMESNTYYGLDSTGARIWQLIQQPRRFSEICDTLLSEYDIDAINCAREVDEFINHMVKMGLARLENE
jgi:hypothetical protein